jgi:hypothetical protein
VGIAHAARPDCPVRVRHPYPQAEPFRFVGGM